MPTTPKGFRYPQGSDNTNLAQYWQNLATDIDNYLNGSAVSIPLASGWTNLAGGYAALQGSRINYLCVVYGVVVNANQYGSVPVNISTNVPAAFRPLKQVMVHGAVEIGATPALQSCRFDVLPNGTITVTPGVTIAANAFHTFTAVYNTNNV